MRLVEHGVDAHRSEAADQNDDGGGEGDDGRVYGVHGFPPSVFTQLWRRRDWTATTPPERKTCGITSAGRKSFLVLSTPFHKYGDVFLSDSGWQSEMILGHEDAPCQEKAPT